MFQETNRKAIVVAVILTAGCSAKTGLNPVENHAAMKPQTAPYIEAPYYVNESPMPYGLRGESIRLLETSPSERNGVYRRPGYVPYVIVSQHHTDIDHVQRPWAVYFKFSSSKIEGPQVGAIQDMVAYLNRNPSRKIKIVGFTDAHGSREINEDLAIARARSVRGSLLKNGLMRGSQITTMVSAPQSHYLVLNGTSKKLAARNRRAEIILVD